ncbi:patatin-like phospholipase family protein [Spirosoma sp. KCTC 42546]|uniref:patatin-like phospholipase family protein n=1 Tax=Spirosoma sp. KCTC 42546 TaxID=2520506 RepID=UPI001156F020|nr:patatin-like phospholipase family protein [Spirosoma sp. KCTC 42546]QDK78535.1 patatin-like phospholipase family protein [Spirosoma sp. KCTC 42546]
MATSLFESATTNRSLILAGGGVRLAYHAGVLKALEESAISFRHVDGTSGGIFNTAMLAAGLDPEEICARWRQLNVMNFVSLTPAENYLRLTRMTAMGDADGIRKQVFPTLGIDVAKIRQNRRFRATFNVCNFSHKTVENIADTQINEDFLIAGMSLPIFMPALQINSDWYTDAVWIKDANLMDAVRGGAEEIWLVYCIGNSREYLDGSFVQYVHMIEMSAAGGLLAEFDWITQINEQIRQGNSPYGQTKPIRLQVIKPTFPLPLDPDLFLKHIDVRALINMGYADTKAYLEHVPAAGVPCDYKAAQMQEPGISMQFMGQFKGETFWEGARVPVKLYALFDLREPVEGSFQVGMFCSLALGLAGSEVSTYKHSVSLLATNGERQLLLTGNFCNDGQIHTIRATFPLSSALDFRLGLDLKRMILQLDENERSTLVQSTRSRLKSSWNSHLYVTAGWQRRWAMKNKLLRLFYNSTNVAEV